MKERDLYKKDVLVTGASSGIGKAISVYLAEDGWNVYAASRNICEEVRTVGKGRITGIRMDVTDEESVRKAAKRIEDLSVIIHSAGFGIASPAECADLDLVRKQFDTNYFGVLSVNSVFLEKLRKNRRSIVIAISSFASAVPLPFQSHYSSSKYALKAYMEALRIEASPFGVQSVLVEPGDTRTSFTSSRIESNIENTVYEKSARRAIDRMKNDEMNGKSPESVARCVSRILRRRNPPVRVTVGLEYKILMFLVKILPERMILYILGMMY